MSENWQSITLAATGAKAVTRGATIQSLWSGYGEIFHAELTGVSRSSIVVKHINLPAQPRHPRGWNTDRSYQRKVESYEVEMNWYLNWNQPDICRTPQTIAVHSQGRERFIIMEDLDASGFACRHQSLDTKGIKTCLQWLARFHSRFLGLQPDGLWQYGSYWHLQTRPDELAAMAAGRLRDAAVKIDSILNAAKYQTILHGDAKVANFCFTENCEQVAAVDFQYTGGGCGMKDVAYFLGSCMDENRCQQQAPELLDYYFQCMQEELNDLTLAREIEKEWRDLFPVAWTDFYRFLAGWMPGHNKINRYTLALADQTLARPVFES